MTWGDPGVLASWTGPALAALAVLTWPPTGLRRLRARWARPGRGQRGFPRTASVAAGWRRLVGTAEPVDVEAEVGQLAEGLAGALRAGLTPAAALGHVAVAGRVSDHPGPSPPSQLLADLAGDLARRAAVGEPLRARWAELAGERGSPGLSALAAGWHLAETRGAALAPVLESLSIALRDDQRTRAAVETALAAPRASARLLAGLPVGGVLLGEVVGVGPVGVLIGTPLGRLCAILGLGSTLLGQLWMRRLVTQAVCSADRR